MRTILMCALAKLKRRKLPNLLLGVCILLTAALLGNALTMVMDLDGLFDEAYREMDGPQLCCLWSREAVPVDKVRQYL